MVAIACPPKKTAKKNDRPTVADFARIKKRVTKNPEAARDFLRSIGVTLAKNGKVVVKPI